MNYFRYFQKLCIYFAVFLCRLVPYGVGSEVGLKVGSKVGSKVLFRFVFAVILL